MVWWEGERWWATLTRMCSFALAEARRGGPFFFVWFKTIGGSKTSTSCLLRHHRPCGQHAWTAVCRAHCCVVFALVFSWVPSACVLVPPCCPSLIGCTERPPTRGGSGVGTRPHREQWAPLGENATQINGGRVQDLTRSSSCCRRARRGATEQRGQGSRAERGGGTRKEPRPSAWS